jgi:hypothetical protein
MHNISIKIKYIPHSFNLILLSSIDCSYDFTKKEWEQIFVLWHIRRATGCSKIWHELRYSQEGHNLPQAILCDRIFRSINWRNAIGSRRAGKKKIRSHSKAVADLVRAAVVVPFWDRTKGMFFHPVNRTIQAYAKQSR